MRIQEKLGSWQGMAIVALTLAIAMPGKILGAEQKTLTVSMRLQEAEWKVMREKILPAFEQRCMCKVNARDVPPEGLAKILEAMAKAGRMKIDVFAQDNMRLAQLVEYGLVRDLSSYEKKIPQQVLPSLIKVGRFGGKLYFMPYRPDVQIAYYNEKRFRQYGLAPPRSWEELLRVAEAFKKKEGIGRVLFKAWGGAPTSTQLYEWIVSAGGDPFVFKHPRTVQTFRFLQRLWPYLSPDSGRAKWDTTNQFLAQESAYLAQNWSFGIERLVKDYGKTDIKTYSGWTGPSREAHVVGGEVLGIPEGSAHKDLALDFIWFMQSLEVQEILTSSLAWPSIRGDAYGQVEEWLRPYFQAVTEALKHGVFRKNVPYWADFEKLINEAFVRIVIHGEDVEKLLNVLHDRMVSIKARS